PDRLIGLGVVPGINVEAASKEARRLAKMGIRGIEVSTSYDMPPLYAPHWEPLWRTLADVNLPIHFHSVPAAFDQFQRGDWPTTGPDWSKNDVAAANAVYVTNTKIAAAPMLSSLVLCGALERYPTFKIVFAETDLGWIPYILDRMDYEFEDGF